MKIRNFLKRLTRLFAPKITFRDIKRRQTIYLYAGDVPQNGFYDKFIGLSLNQADSQHIEHDITKPIPLPDSCVDIYQSEDVFEHIQLERLPAVITEIYRILKSGGVFRLSMPDYQCDMLSNRCIKSSTGALLFDPEGGGDFVDGEIINGGHVWFPTYEQVRILLEESKFENIHFYHYYDETGQAVTKPIDYSIGYIMRTPDHDHRVQKPYRPMSIVVDCIK